MSFLMFGLKLFGWLAILGFIVAFGWFVLYNIAKGMSR